MVEPLNLTPDCAAGAAAFVALRGMRWLLRSGDELKLTPPRARWEGEEAESEVVVVEEGE
jgi:hypothetical protein